ncbi:hypothetical protein Purlil1_1433 [Purpureocillium lilacinum]|uniref:Major facilitator superfamily (MFS) profile domain-containing protein n=3 Tax=Purpureocillium lilacinum TaxID=33203 RepID=A0ABR0CCR9_PURLI|nr:hypothetical protein Purlil1_1433 [Purpureocillium lilacinum]
MPVAHQAAIIARPLDRTDQRTGVENEYRNRVHSGVKPPTDNGNVADEVALNRRVQCRAWSRVRLNINLSHKHPVTHLASAAGPSAPRISNNRRWRCGDKLSGHGRCEWLARPGILAVRSSGYAAIACASRAPQRAGSVNCRIQGGNSAAMPRGFLKTAIGTSHLAVASNNAQRVSQMSFAVDGLPLTEMGRANPSPQSRPAMQVGAVGICPGLRVVKIPPPCGGPARQPADHGPSGYKNSEDATVVISRPRRKTQQADTMAAPDSKLDIAHDEHQDGHGPNMDVKHADRALALIGNAQVELTEEDSRRICRKTDRVILAILVWVYFLQILDKSVLGYGATYGLKTDTGLTGNQYSLVGSIAPIAQLAWQPFSSFLIVKVPHRILMPVLCLGWGIAQAAMAACHNFGGLMASRFFLGLFEAGCLPLFSIITSQWYRRAEQPIRVAAWYGTNGLATIVAAGISYGLGHIKSDILKEWQIIFLFVGLVTIVSAPFVYWKLDNDIPSARFLTEHEKAQAIERLRANQTGTGSRDFKWRHVLETALEPKTYLWIGMAMLLNVGASVTNTFGPLILNGIATDKYQTSLLNMPFGALQCIVILSASWLAQKAKLKGAVLAAFMLPVVAGLAVLYSVKRDGNARAPLLVGYYLLAFLFGGNPLIVTWIVGNTGGTTKKSAIMSVYNAASSAGNIIGPLLFNDRDAPEYKPGLRACLGIFVALVAVIFMQWANLMVLNRLQEKRRVQNGKQAKVVDRSMQDHYHSAREVDDMEIRPVEEEGVAVPEPKLGENAFLDMTDRENDEFIYIY